MSKYEEAKEIAQKIVELEKVRKSAQEKLSALKDELLGFIAENDIESMFEFNDGVVYLDTTITYKIADGLKEETQVSSKSPEKLSQDFVDAYFAPDLKLSKLAKQAIKEEDTDLLAVLVPVEKAKIKVAVKDIQ